MSEPPELPPEVWKVIIAFCRTPLPEAGKEGVTWHELHQHHLTTLMRTSSMLNELTSPALYTEIVVDNIAALYVGIDLPYTSRPVVAESVEPKTDGCLTAADVFDPATAALPTLDLSAKRYHKRDLLGMVRAMHLIHSAVDEHPFDHIEVDMEVSMFTDDQNFEEAWQATYSGRDVDRYLGNAATISRAGYTYSELFPHLQRRTSLAWSPHEWDVDSKSYHRNASALIIGAVQNCNRRLAARISIPSAPYVCGHLRDGPLASAWLGVGEQDDGSLLPPVSQVLVNAVHQVRLGTVPAPILRGHIVLGTENHLYLYDPRRMYNYSGGLLLDGNLYTEIDDWALRETQREDWPHTDEETLKRTKVIALIPRPTEGDAHQWSLPDPPGERRAECPWTVEVAW